MSPSPAMWMSGVCFKFHAVSFLPDPSDPGRALASACYIAPTQELEVAALASSAPKAGSQ